MGGEGCSFSMVRPNEGSRIRQKTKAIGERMQPDARGYCVLRIRTVIAGVPTGVRLVF